MKKILLGIIVLVIIISLYLVLFGGYKTYKYNEMEANGKTVAKKIKYRLSKKETNYVLLDTSFGLIVIKLYPDIAPISVANFKSLVSADFYDNLLFHRVIKDFVIQTGDPTGNGNGGSNKTIKGEFSNNGVTNNLSHLRGVVSMARADYSMDSANSQFFIVVKNSTSLDGNYAAFGKVIAGMEVVDTISLVETNENDKPINDIKINSIKFIEIKGEV